MRRTTALAVVVVVCSVSLPIASTERIEDSGRTEVFRNETRRDALGIRVTFSKLVRIADYNEAFFPFVSPDGRSKEFVFSGGRLLDQEEFYVSWQPTTAGVRSHKWYTDEEGSEIGSRSSCAYRMHPDASDLALRLQASYDGLVLCLEPGTYRLTQDVSTMNSITLRGRGDSPSDVTLIAPEGKSRALQIHEDAWLRLENLTLAGSWSLTAAQEAQYILLGVHTEAVSIQVTQSASLIAQSSRLTAGDHAAIQASGTGEVRISETLFAGTGTGCSVLENVHLTVSDCVFADSLAASISLDGSSVTVVGSGNTIPPGTLLPLDYGWPDEFLANSACGD
ncbi:hypothetical protein ACFLTM_01575 [Candidatus Bipolaricaulota bacterium]